MTDRPDGRGDCNHVGAWVGERASVDGGLTLIDRHRSVVRRHAGRHVVHHKSERRGQYIVVTVCGCDGHILAIVGAVAGGEGRIPCPCSLSDGPDGYREWLRDVGHVLSDLVFLERVPHNDSLSTLWTLTTDVALRTRPTISA